MADLSFAAIPVASEQYKSNGHNEEPAREPEPLQEPSSSSTGGPGGNPFASSLKGVGKGMHDAIPAGHKDKGTLARQRQFNW